MSDKLLGSDINPKATTQAQTDMTATGSFTLPDDFDIESFRPQKEENYEVSIGDGAKAFVSGSLRAFEGAAEMQNQTLKTVSEKAKADDGILSTAATAVQSIPLVKAATATTPYIKKAFSSVATAVENTFSDDAKAALSKPVWEDGDNWKASSDPAVWGMQFSKAMGYMVPTIVTALATGGASSAATLPNLMQAMIRSGANPQLAAKAAPIALNILMKAPVIGAGMSTDLGSQGESARKNVIDADHSQLMNSEQYQQAFIDIDSNPEYINLSDGQKFELAKEHISDQASRSTMTDARSVAASAAATMIGDAPLAKALLKGFKGSAGGLRGALGGAATGVVREAPLEAIQEGTQQRVSNEISNEYAGTNLDPNQGVTEAAVSGGLMGAAMGGSMGAVGGLRSATQPEPEITAELTPKNTEIDADQVDVSSTSDLGTENEQPTPDNRTHAQWGYTKEEAVDDLDAPAFLREELHNQEGPQPQQPSASIDPNDLETPAFMRQGKTINTDPIVEPPQQTENLPAVNELEGEWIGANEQQAQPQKEAEPPASISHEQQPRLKGENVIYGEAPYREPVDDHMEQQAAAPQFNAGEQVKGDVFMPHEQSTELQPVSDVKQQVVIDGEYFTVERNGVGTQLVPSEAPPSVVYGHDNTPQQQEPSLDDKQVGTPYFENGIPKNKLRQLKYLAQRISDKIPLAMQPLKGAARFTRPEYRTRLVSLADEATAMSNSKTINVQVDTISDAIAKLGGVNRTSAESDGIDPAAFKRNKLFPAKDGRTFDELAEVLNEHGFTSRTGGKLGANDVLDLVDSEVNNGERHFSTQSDMLTETDQGSALSDLVREYGAERVQTAISKALTGARLGDRQAEIVSEAMDVIETGRIEQAGGIEARHAERDARREVRVAKRHQKADIVNSDLGLPAWVNDDAAQAESEYTETVEAALDQAISHAAIADPVAAENLLDQYEFNKITMASLIDQLGALKHDDQQKLTNMENTQPTTEGAHSDSSAQRTEQGQEDTQPNMGAIGSGSTTSDQQHAAVAEVEPHVSVTTDTAPQVEITQDPAIEAVIEREQSDTATKQDAQQEVITEKPGQAPPKSQPIKSHGVSIDAPYITQETQDNYNRATHIGSGRDFNAELTSLANDQLNELHEKGLLDTPERIAVAKQSIEALLNKQVDFITRESNYATNNPSWIVTGRSGRNMDKVNKRNDRHMSDFSKRVDEIENLRESIVSTVEAVRNEQQKVDHEKATKQAQIKKHEKVIVDYLAQTYQYLLEGKPALARDARVWVNKKVTKQLNDLIEKDKDAAYLLINKINKAYNKEGKVTLIDVVSSRTALGKQLKQIIDADNKPSKSNKPTSFSREGVTPDTDTTTKGMPLKQAEMAVRSWIRQYNGGAMVNVKVVQTQVEAEQILGASLDGYKVNAFYNEVDATVVVVADNIANTKELRQKLRHEILVHHGLRAVVGDAEYGRILKTVYSGLDSRFLKPLIAEVEKSYSRSNLNNFVEEVLAHAAESDRNQIQKWRDRIITKIAQALRKVGLLTPSDITQAELNNIVQTLTDRIKAVNEWDPSTPPPSGNGMEGHLSRTKFSRTVNSQSHTSAFQSAVDQARAKLSAKMNGPIADVADAGFDIPTDNLKSTIARKLADKFQVLKELQKNIVKSGGNINEDNDAYLAEELFHGKAENDLRIMKDTFVKPLADKMAKHGISQAQLDEYLIARHAQERNDYIASINPKFPDGGSGMKNADAQAKLNEIRNSGKQQKYDELAHIVDAMITKQRDVLRDSGLESDEIIDTWQSHYKHYVPLKGIAKDESSLPRTGKGFSIGGKEVKSAMGRKSMAESPSGHAILDLTEKLVRARKNEVGNTLLKMVNDNPSADYWQVFTTDNPDTAPQISERKNPLTGEKEKIVEDRPVPMAMLKDFYFPTKKDGKVYYIKLHDQRLMSAMQNMGPDNSNGIIRFMAGFNRILASVNTSYNPEFVVGNFLRDIQTTVLNLSAEQSRDDGKIKGEAIVKQTIKDIRKAAPAIYASLRNKTSKSPETQEWQRHFEEFMEVGGKTGWFDMKDVDGQAKELDRMVAMANGSITGKAYKAFENVTGFVENINGSIENAVRLSAYVNARKAGISKKKAASLAKNMTVNFNRRGEVGTTLNAMYMFANASIQGSANFIRTMGDLNGDGKLKWQNLNNAQKIAIGVVTGSFALAFANRGVAGDDEDGVNWFDKIPSYVKERNFIIMKSLLGGDADGSYWSIPMPYGYNLFSIAGTGIESAINSDNVTPMQMAGDMALATLGSFSPIGMSSSDTAAGTVLKNVLPTIAKPFFEVSTNENFFGGQIYQENMPFGAKMPDSSMAKRATSDHYKAVAEWLNESTGGSAYRSGAIDLSPDVMQYIVGYFGGAAMRFADVKVPGLFSKAIGGDVEDSKVAFLSRISGRVMPYQDQSIFYDRRDELMQINNEIGTVKATDRVAYMKDHGYKLQLLPMLKMTEKQLKALRKQRNAVYALDLPRAQKDLRLKSVERQMKMLIDRFNLRYAQLEGK